MHLGLIMDGNGRWASQRHLPRAAGHLEGMKACKRVIVAAKKLGIDYLTLYVFSTENWKRPEQEVNYLMGLLAKKLPSELRFYQENNIRILFRGDIQNLPLEAQESIKKTEQETSSMDGITVILAINYGGQDEIARACTRFLEKNKENNITKITIDDIQNNLDLPFVSAPDMIARSAGEMRLSNFMLWDSAYAEFLSLDDLWPDWGELQIQKCIEALSKELESMEDYNNNGKKSKT